MGEDGSEAGPAQLQVFAAAVLGARWFDVPKGCSHPRERCPPHPAANSEGNPTGMFQVLRFSPVVLRIWGVPLAAAAEELGEVTLIPQMCLGVPGEGSTSHNSNLHPVLAALLPQLPAQPHQGSALGARDGAGSKQSPCPHLHPVQS